MLITAIAVLGLSDKSAINLKNWDIFCFTMYNTSNFYPLEVVGRGSETQLQVDKN